MSRVWLGPSDELASRGQTRIERDDLRLAVFWSGERFDVIDDRCSHAEASLAEGVVTDGEVECPRHGALFDLKTGDALCLPATRPVRVYPVAVVEGDVFIDLEESS